MPPIRTTSTLSFGAGSATTAAVLLLSAPAAHAQSTLFPDVPANHWAYESIRDLAAKGLVKGYPDGTFLGNRALTRYEFASALDRILQTVADMAKVPGAPVAPPGVTQEDLNKIQVLADAFQKELTAIQADVTAAKADITTLREKISALQADVASARQEAAQATATANQANETATKAAETASQALDLAGTSFGVGANRRFQIGGFAQFRYERAESANNAAYPAGTGTGNAYNGSYLSGTNPQSFKIREARLFFTGAVSPNARYMAEISTAGAVNTTTAGSTSVALRRMYGQYTFGDGSPKNLSVQFGQFWNPFGYMINAPRPTWYQPERPLAFGEFGPALFANQEFDRGIKLMYAPMPYTISLSVINGSGLNSNDTNRFADFVARGTYALLPSLNVGVSGYWGKMDMGPTTPQDGATKRLVGADLQFTSPSGPFLQAEYVGGTYEAIPPVVAGTPKAFRQGNKIDGYYLIGGYTFSPRGRHPLSLAVSYDAFNRDRDVDSFTDENIGGGILYNLDRTTRARLWYTKPTKVAHPAGTPAPREIGLLSSELQVRF